MKTFFYKCSTGLLGSVGVMEYLQQYLREWETEQF